MIPPPVWSDDELQDHSERAREHFRQGRLTEPLEVFLEIFDEYRGVVEEVLEQTVDLSRLREEVVDLIRDPRKLEVIRYLAGPPVSEDDLKVLIRTDSLAPSRFGDDEDLVDNFVGFIQEWHDRRRFPWVNDSWEPEEHDRNVAIEATTALIATRRLETWRRNVQRRFQEDAVKDRLIRASFRQVERRTVRVIADAPGKQEFCRESKFGGRKADFLVGLPDGRTMAIECKVSNSATNSIKRLNNDAAAKAEDWKNQFGSAQVVTAAVLEGVYKLRHLRLAQERGLTLFWSHDLTDMFRWIRSIRN